MDDPWDARGIANFGMRLERVGTQCKFTFTNLIKNRDDVKDNKLFSLLRHAV